MTLTSATAGTETYYYSIYGGSATSEQGDYGEAFQISVRVGAGRSSFTVSISTIEDTEVEGDETFYLYVTGEANHPGSTPGSSRYRGTGTIRNDDTEPTLGRYTYTFSLNNRTYTVTSDDCYSQSISQNRVREYLAGLEIYDDRNELVRPTNDILFQLSAAHGIGVCMIDGINFGERLAEINNLVSYCASV